MPSGQRGRADKAGYTAAFSPQLKFYFAPGRRARKILHKIFIERRCIVASSK